MTPDTPVEVRRANPVAEMERTVACLAVELPGELWDAVRDRWDRVRDEIDRLRTALADERRRNPLNVRVIEDPDFVLPWNEP